jgi:hypothetical protein|tara:strand:+ start:309 stop:476 length:168 start_codon:yes stop_codon:yes gene_type:complete
VDKSGSISTEELVDALKKWNIPVSGVLEQLMKVRYTTMTLTAITMTTITTLWLCL